MRQIIPHQRQATIANEIIRSHGFNYFESKSAARRHARAEGIPVSTIVDGVGSEGNYSKVPRRYRPDLKAKLAEAFALVATTEGQPFIHSDSHTVVAGITHPKSEAPNGKYPELIVPYHGRSSFLRMPIGLLVQRSMMPPLNIARHPGDDPEISEGRVEIKLGRSTLVGGESDFNIDRAVRDSYHPYESVLAVGEDAVRAYSQAMQATAGAHAPRSTEDLGRAEAVVQVYEAIT